MVKHFTIGSPETVPVNIKPEFVRLPKVGTLCPHTGLTRAKMNELVLPCEANQFKPPVHSVSLRRPGQLKGVRLVDYASLIAYLRSFAIPEAA